MGAVDDRFDCGWQSRKEYSRSLQTVLQYLRGAWVPWTTGLIVDDRKQASAPRWALMPLVMSLAQLTSISISSISAPLSIFPLLFASFHEASPTHIYILYLYHPMPLVMRQLQLASISISSDAPCHEATLTGIYISTLYTVGRDQFP